MISKQIIHTLAYNLLFIFTRFILFYALGKNLLPSEYGAYGLITSLVTLSVYFFGIELYNYTWRTAPGKPKIEGLKLLKSSLLFELLLAMAVIMVLTSSGFYMRFWERLNFGLYIPHFNLALIIVVLNIVFLEFKRYLTIVKKVEAGNYANFISNLLWVYPLVYIFFVNKFHSIWLLLWFWLGGLLMSVIFELHQIGASDFFQAPIDLKLVFKEIIPFSMPLLVPSLSFYIMQLSNRYFIAYFQDPKAVGIFSFLFMFVNTLYLIGATIFTGVFPPYIIEAHNKNDLQRRDIMLMRLLKYPLVLLVLGGVILLINDSNILAIFAKPEYKEGKDLFKYLVAYPILIAFIAPAKYILFLNNKTKLISISYLAGIIFYFILSFVLIPTYSYYGAAIAMVFSFFMTCGLIYYFAKRYFLFRIKDLKLYSFFIASVLSYFVGLMSVKYFGLLGNIASFIFSTFIIIFAFLLSFYFSGGIERNTIEKAKKIGLALILSKAGHAQ